MTSRLVIALALVCGLAPGNAVAQTYRWVDESGRVQYSNSPPPLQAVPEVLPAPRITVSGPVPLEMRGRALRGYVIEVTNRSAYPEAFFTPPPGGPPCGRTHGARTWVDIYTAEGKRLRLICIVTSMEYSLAGSRRGAAMPVSSRHLSRGRGRRRASLITFVL